MELTEILQTYFRGEKIEAAFFIAPAGLVLLVVGIAALRAERGGFGWGVAVPCIGFGLVLLAVGIGVAGRTSGQVTALLGGYQASPAEMLRDEVARMHTVVRNFAITLPVFGAVAGLGLLVRFVLPWEWAKGAGPVLVLVGGIGLLIDGIADRRATPYVAALEAAAQEHGAT